MTTYLDAFLNPLVARLVDEAVLKRLAQKAEAVT
jgi:hypothetical protein